MADDLEQVFAKVPAEVAELTKAVGRLVLDAQPDLKEYVYPGWMSIVYGYGGEAAEQVCILAPADTYLTVYFPRGANLPDPDGLLKGNAFKMRQIRIDLGEEIPKEAIKGFVKASAEIVRGKRRRWSKKRKDPS